MGRAVHQVRSGEFLNSCENGNLVKAEMECLCFIVARLGS